MLDPYLPVVGTRIVFEQVKGRGLLREASTQSGNQRSKLSLLVKPQTDLGTLLVVEALLKLADQGVEDHEGPTEAPRGPR